MRWFKVENVQDPFHQVVVLILQKFSNNLIIVLQDFVQSIMDSILL